MASSSHNTPATDSASTLRELAGNDPTANFEDDPTFVDANPVSAASSENLGAAAADDEVEDADIDDDDVDEDDLEDDELDEDDDEDDDEYDDEDDDEDDDADEAGTTARLHAAGVLDMDSDDDAGDDGRENAVDEDALNADQEDDLDFDEPGLSPVEQETVRRREVGLLPSAPAALHAWM